MSVCIVTYRGRDLIGLNGKDAVALQRAHWECNRISFQKTPFVNLGLNVYFLIMLLAQGFLGPSYSFNEIQTLSLLCILTILVQTFIDCI